MKQVTYLLKAFIALTILPLTFNKGFANYSVKSAVVTTVAPAVQLEAAILTNKVVRINWKATATTTNADIEIERSIDQLNFKTICYIMASEGPEFSPNTPGFKDKTAAEAGNTTLYYRLKQTARDGKVTYSDVITVTIK